MGAGRSGTGICRSGRLRSRCMTGGSRSGGASSCGGGVVRAWACCGRMPSSPSHRLTGSACLGVEAPEEAWEASACPAGVVWAGVVGTAGTSGLPCAFDGCGGIVSSTRVRTACHCGGETGSLCEGEARRAPEAEAIASAVAARRAFASAAVAADSALLEMPAATASATDAAPRSAAFPAGGRARLCGIRCILRRTCLKPVPLLAPADCDCIDAADSEVLPRARRPSGPGCERCRAQPAVRLSSRSEDAGRTHGSIFVMCLVMFMVASNGE